MAKDKTNGGHKISEILFFILLSALLWLIIKLSATYTVVVPFDVHFTDVPADYIIDKDDYKVEVAMTTTGFKLLNYYLKTQKKRKINISLKNNQYIYKGDNVFSLGKSQIEDAVSSFMQIHKNEVSMEDNEIIFVMNELAFKKVKVIPDIQVQYEKQFSNYGLTKTSPDSITIFGPQDILDGINHVYTQFKFIKNVNKDIQISIPVSLDPRLHSNIDNVNVFIDVENFTETETEVPISLPANCYLRLFPDKIKVKYVVALKDYSNINSMSFHAEIDTISLKQKEDLLPVQLTIYPNNIQNISFYPSKVEYIITNE